MNTPTNCSMCGKPLLPRDAAAYGNRCEDCWSGGNVKGFAAAFSAAECHNFGPQCLSWEDVEMMTNLLPERDEPEEE